MTDTIVLIAGATGAAASRLTQLVARTPGWQAAVANTGAVTHMVYAARAPFGEGGVEGVAANPMLKKRSRNQTASFA